MSNTLGEEMGKVISKGIMPPSFALMTEETKN